MRISIGQILIALIISFLLIGDVNHLKKKLKTILEKIKKARKKGI